MYIFYKIINLLKFRFIFSMLFSIKLNFYLNNGRRYSKSGNNFLNLFTFFKLVFNKNTII